jgi:hypothetical protein
LKLSAVSFNSGLSKCDHVTFRPSLSVMKSHGLTLVSCSIFERMISSQELRILACKRFMKSCVVEAPRTTSSRPGIDISCGCLVGFFVSGVELRAGVIRSSELNIGFGKALGDANSRLGP